MIRWLSVLILLSGCDQTKPYYPDVPDEVRYEPHVYSLMSNKCSACHNASVPARNWMDYDTAYKNRYSILGRVSSRTMPPGKPLPPSEIELIRRWVAQGAKR